MKKTRTARRLIAGAAIAAGLMAAQGPPALAADAPLDVENLTAIQAEGMLKAGSLTSVQLTQAYIDRITALNKRGPGLNAVTQFNKDALVAAAQSDADRKAGIDAGPLMGLPVLLKDIVDAKGMYTSAGNWSLRQSFPAEDSGVAKNLKAKGAIILGKTGLSEFANFFGSQPSGFSNLTGQVLNAIDADQNPSGSSSGSGSAGAAGLASLTIGTETNGSIISPSSTQGIVGLRPTVGLVPGYGIAPIYASQDTAGPMVRTVGDAALELQAIAGKDPEADAEYKEVFGDDYLAKGIIPAQPDTVPDYLSALSTDFVKGKRVGYIAANVQPGTVYQQAYDALVAGGATMVAVTQTNPTGLPASQGNYEAHKTIDSYYAHLGPQAPIKSLADEVSDNLTNPQEALKFGNATHLSVAQTDSSAGGANEQAFRSAIVTRKAAYHKSIDDMLNRGTADPSDDVIAILGNVSNGPVAGYPQMTVPMGYTATTRRAQAINVNGGAYGERDVIGVGYVIEQATKLRQPASQVDPSLYRCARTVPAEPFADRGDCNPDYDAIMSAVGTAPTLGFPLETESLQSLQDRLAAGTLTSVDLTKAYLSRIALSNAEGPATQAVRSVDAAGALAAAAAADQQRAASGRGGPLLGIPVLVDDSIDVNGMETSAGSIALQGHKATADSALVAKLRRGGAIILGKANVSELNGFFDAAEPEGYSSLGGQVLVPSDTDKTPGGSSAGSSAGVASGLAAAAIGLETGTDGAQLIAPAGVNGVVGLKPTVGLVSRTGVLGVARSQDSPGTIARTVQDAAETLQVIAGRDSSDAATAAAPTGVDYTAGLRTTALRGRRIATVASTSTQYADALAALQSAGATTQAVTPGAAPTQASIVPREFKRDLNAYLATGTGGATSLSAIIAYNAAHPQEGLKYQQGELTAAQAVDLTDAATQTQYASDRDAGKAAAASVIDTALTNGTPATTDDADLLAVPSGSALVGVADRAGYPVLTVPAGYGAQNSGSGRDPVGVSFIGTAYSEAQMLADGYAFEQATKVRQAPSVTNPSMWRCVPGSAFYSPHQCNPGDHSNPTTFTAIPSDVPPTSTTPTDTTPTTPTGTTPATTTTTPTTTQTTPGTTTAAVPVPTPLPGPAPAPAGGPSGNGTLPSTRPIVRSTALRARGRKVVVTIQGSVSFASLFRGTLRLRSAGSTLASRTFAVAPGRSRTVTMVLTKRGAATLARHRKGIRVTVAITTKGADGVTRTATRRVTLRKAA